MYGIRSRRNLFFGNDTFHSGRESYVPVRRRGVYGARLYLRFGVTPAGFLRLQAHFNGCKPLVTFYKNGKLRRARINPRVNYRFREFVLINSDRRMREIKQRAEIIT
jgi:hypothetical protein